MALSQSKTVLVVDDNPTVLKLYAEILALGDYRTIPCPKATQAIEVLREEVPALLVLNPGPSGAADGTITRVVERDSRLVHLPVLFCTSAHRIAQSPVKPRTRPWGAIQKPF